MSIIDFNKALILRKRSHLVKNKILADKFRREYEEELKAFKRYHFKRYLKVLLEIRQLEDFEEAYTDPASHERNV
jgi:hypothetical protein